MLHLRDEHGIALIMAMLILMVFAIALSAVIYFTSTNSRSASYTKAQQVAYNLAEAGINNQLSILFNPVNGADLLNPNLIPAQGPKAYEGGTVTWKGTIDTNDVWTLTATGTVVNPTGQGVKAVTRTLTARVPITGPATTTLRLPVWNFIYTARKGNVCDMTIDQSVALKSPLFVEGNLCLRSTATITGGPLGVGGSLTLDQPQNGVGSSSTPVPEIFVGNGCTYKNGGYVNPCRPEPSTPRTNIYATSFYTTIPSDLTGITLPPVDWGTDGWYRYASPGPFRACTTSSGPVPVFENMTVDPSTGGTIPDMDVDGDVPGNFDLAPSASDYTCSTSRGTLAWNHVTHTLTVSGTIFIDGSAFVNNGAANVYTGQGVIYLGGTLLIKNSKLCANHLNAAKTDCDFAGWDPNSTLLVFATHGQGGQVAVGDGIQVVSSSFQGGFYADYAIDASTTSTTQGPLVSGTQVMVGQTNGVAFPQIRIVPVGMPGYSPDVWTASVSSYGG
jgi:Tfp pilus assembly protein PilV